MSLRWCRKIDLVFVFYTNIVGVWKHFKVFALQLSARSHSIVTRIRKPVKVIEERKTLSYTGGGGGGGGKINVPAPVLKIRIRQRIAYYNEI